MPTKKNTKKIPQKKIAEQKEETDNDDSSSEEEEKHEEDPPQETSDSSSDEEKSEEKQSENPSNVLKERVSTYIKIDNLISEKRDEIKSLCEKRVKCEEYIKKYLEDNNKDVIETNDGKIVFKKQTVKTPLKEDLIIKAIVSRVDTSKEMAGSGQQIAKDIVEELNKLRGVNVKSSIRRIKKRDKKT